MFLSARPQHFGVIVVKCLSVVAVCSYAVMCGCG